MLIDFGLAVFWNTFVVLHSFRGGGGGEEKIIFWRKGLLKAIFIQILVRLVTMWSTRLIHTKNVDMSVGTKFLHNFEKCISEKWLRILKIIKSTKIIPIYVPFWILT